MLFLKTLLTSISLFTPLAAAQSTTLFFSDVPTTAKAGVPYTIKYNSPDLNSAATILLRKGDSNHLATVGVLTSTATGGTFEWIPEVSLHDGDDYALQITQGSEVNYSGKFGITGGSPAAISAASIATYAASVAASASHAAVTAASKASSGIESILPIFTTNSSRPSMGFPSMTPGKNSSISKATLTTAKTTAGHVTSMTTVMTASLSTTGSGSESTSSGLAAAYQLPGSLALALGAVGAAMYLN